MSELELQLEKIVPETDHLDAKIPEAGHGVMQWVYSPNKIYAGRRGNWAINPLTDQLERVFGA